MAEQESAAVRNANKLFHKKEEQAKEGAAAWKEYLEQADATRLKTAKLRAQRLARDAAAASAVAPVHKRAARTPSVIDSKGPPALPGSSPRRLAQKQH